jgi:hypothetical protein
MQELATCGAVLEAENAGKVYAPRWLRTWADFDVENSKDWNALSWLLDGAAVGGADAEHDGLALAVTGLWHGHINLNAAALALRAAS